jgi:hypothetical protein
MVARPIFSDVERLQHSADELELGSNYAVRALNALHFGGVRTIGELVATPDSELFKARNCGRRTIERLRAATARYLGWTETLVRGRLPREEPGGTLVEKRVAYLAMEFAERVKGAAAGTEACCRWTEDGSGCGVSTAKDGAEYWGGFEYCPYCGRPGDWDQLD